MEYNPHRDARSEAEWADKFARANRENVDREATKALLEHGHPHPELGNALVFSYDRMKVVVARRTRLNRKNTVTPYLEEASCEDDDALFMLQDDPIDGKVLFMFKPDHPHYFPDGTPRTSPPSDNQATEKSRPRRRQGGGDA